MGATPICVRRRTRRAAATALTAAVVFLLFVGALAESASAGIFSDATSRLFGRSKSLDLAPIVGAPANVTEEFAQQLVAAGKNNKLTITPNGTGSSYIIKGYLLATSERKGAKISYILDINDSKGGKVGRVSGEQVVARPFRRRPVERRRQRRDPKPRRQDRPADCLDPIGRQRCAASGCLRSATLPWDIPKRWRQTVHHDRHRPCPPRGQGASDGDGFTGLRSPRRRHEVADRGHQEAPLCQGG